MPIFGPPFPYYMGGALQWGRISVNEEVMRGGQAITHPPFLSAGHESKPGFPRDKGD